MKNNFGFFLPAEVIKAKDDSGVEKMRIAGIASTTDEDSDEEILLPSGFDLSYFTNNGFVNWHHRQKDKPSAIIGEPSEAKIIQGGKQMKVVCDLYNTPLAKEVYDLGVVLQTQSKTGRRLGFSIEGKVLERDANNPKIVTKAAITGCAITYQPKNGSTIAEIVKADGASPDFDLTVDIEGLKEDLALLGQDAGKEILKACESDIKKDVSEDLDKQKFESGKEDDDEDEKDEEDDDEDEVKKDLTSSSPSGAAIKPESLDNKLKDNREPFLSKAEVQVFLDSSGIEVDIETFQNFVEQVKNITTMTKQASTITKADLDNALALLEKASKSQPDEIEPEENEDEEDDDDNEESGKEESKEMKKSMDSDIEKAIKEMAEANSSGFGAIRTLFTDITSQFSNLAQSNELLKAQVEELSDKVKTFENAPANQRKGILRDNGTRAIEKSFDADNLNKGGNGGEQLSISRNKAKIVAKLEELAFPPAGGFNDVFAKAMTVFESSSNLSPVALEALRKQGIEIIN